MSVLQSKILNIREEYHKSVVGQDDILNYLLMAIFVNGHILLEGFPGLAKTKAVKTFASISTLDFSRIQFTPDLLPADIIGTEIYSQKTGEFYTRKGPLFSQVILSDEINRSPSKVQSALLEAMEERQITIGEKTYPLDTPFIVIATQNPIEQEGTYPLPEAQLDRFLFKVTVNYPSIDDEKKILQLGDVLLKSLNPILTSDNIISMQKEVNSIYIDEKLLEYILNIVSMTRDLKNLNLNNVELIYGASPRASLGIMKASKAHAYIQGRDFVSVSDIQTVVFPILRHRIMFHQFEYDNETLKADMLIKKILQNISAP